ncbi:DUF3025 domain-containing protein [Leeia sp. TBRC 13508]|uniref:DUF3025 domain-containing protein n=1 Tax=Leeia speluncae TaxID=2884804 RepID=A0ABS8D5B4_9NEIS|nr:DUF3025 domain-containing protein [Leeia speluncae]MCB6183414.1 DUF3025 domain-containing protein [Leeia speluncae]
MDVLSQRQVWNPHVLQSGQWFSPLYEWDEAIQRLLDWPSYDWLNAEAVRLHVCNDQGMPLEFIQQDEPMKALAYEKQIYETGKVPTRLANWHDFFNALCWFRFPNSKSIMNAMHAKSEDTISARGKMRDALTLFDECGIVIEVADDTWKTRLQSHDWKGVWWVDRQTSEAEVEYTLFGHSEFEKGMTPFRGWTAKALFLPRNPNISLDERVANVLASGALMQPRELSPLPVLGVPTWHEGQDASYYDDTDYFRPARQRV